MNLMSHVIMEAPIKSVNSNYKNALVTNAHILHNKATHHLEKLITQYKIISMLNFPKQFTENE